MSGHERSSRLLLPTLMLSQLTKVNASAATGVVRPQVSLRFNMRKYAYILLTVFPLAAGSVQTARAQAGMTVSPGKLYYTLAPGTSGTQKLMVSNPNNRELEVVVSMNDWNYDSLGNNQTYDAGKLPNSSASWVQVLPGSYFTLGPKEKMELDVVVNAPPDMKSTYPVHTSMLFLTQLNATDAKSSDGTAIKVSVRMGVKIYHTIPQPEEREIEITNFTDILPQKKEDGKNGFLELRLENTGKIWLEGIIKWELLNTRTGAKTKLSDQEIYSLPGDKRVVRHELPPNLPKGEYTATAIINYGNKDEFKLVELEFIY